MQSEAARRAGDPPHQSEDPSPEGLGAIRVPWPRPIRAVQWARLCAITCTASQAPLAAKRPDGMWFSTHAVLEVAYGVLDLGVTAVIGLQFQRLPVPGDEAWRRERSVIEGVIAVSEEGELGTPVSASPAGR